MFIIIANFGDDSIALIQWVVEHQLQDVHVVSVDTGWAAQAWDVRVEQGEAFAREQGLNVSRLKSKLSFADLVRDRGEFPNKKFQWCAGFLKGVVINQYLDEVDPGCEATILLGKWRDASRANQHLAERDLENEYYNYRPVWYPLYQLTRTQRDELIHQAGFEILNHRSLECDPCIHSTPRDLLCMDQDAVKKTAVLEQELSREIFAKDGYNGAAGIEAVIKWVNQSQEKTAKNYQENFDMGCGSPWGCGE